MAWKNSTPKDLKNILEARDRSLVGTTAPARGLFLNKVEYPINGEVIK